MTRVFLIGHLASVDVKQHEKKTRAGITRIAFSSMTEWHWTQPDGVIRRVYGSASVFPWQLISDCTEAVENDQVRSSPSRRLSEVSK